MVREGLILFRGRIIERRPRLPCPPQPGLRPLWVGRVPKGRRSARFLSSGGPQPPAGLTALGGTLHCMFCTQRGGQGSSDLIRSLSSPRCPPPDGSCGAGFAWDELGCQCVSSAFLSLSEQELGEWASTQSFARTATYYTVSTSELSP